MKDNKNATIRCSDYTQIDQPKQMPRAYFAAIETVFARLDKEPPLGENTHYANLWLMGEAMRYDCWHGCLWLRATAAWPEQHRFAAAAAWFFRRTTEVFGSSETYRMDRKDGTMEKIIGEFRVIETDAVFRVEIKGDKEAIRQMLRGWFGPHIFFGAKTPFGRGFRFGFSPGFWGGFGAWGGAWEASEEEKHV